ncbi:coiled-coil domain-containing protein-domain-containing protein [Leptodontidium sp. MPI-SDFR-AT-0119]|nr:coiled-coil domain-containing protein-domain-containing protein [Leptodontidium sp. MPI-SDFR-AT-0119]
MPHFQSPEPVSQPDSFFSESSTQSQFQTRSQSQERAQRIRIKNRRKLYLDRHPSYFASPDLELADPLLYDRCIRRFQSASEREADGRAKGYSGVLEADMYRTEAKIAALHPESPSHSPSSSRTKPPNEDTAGFVPFVSYLRGSHGEVLPEEDDEVPKTKEEGLERWKFGMTVRFLKGDDEDFDYAAVDGSDELDDVERREREESWFEGEEPEWVAEAGKSGETGVQDF